MAAYNAGATPVRQWWKARTTDDLEVFVELIPFTETRGFVQKLVEGPAPVIQLAKRLVYRGLDTGLMESLEAAAAAMAIVRTAPDAREGPRAMAEKRKPRFTSS